jgi:hypothetical protein
MEWIERIFQHIDWRVVQKHGWKRRLKIFLLGLAVVFVLHLLKILIFVKYDYAIHMKVGGIHYWSLTQQRFYRYLKDFIFLIVNQIFPIVIWSVFYVKYWWSKRIEFR